MTRSPYPWPDNQPLTWWQRALNRILAPIIAAIERLR